MFESDSPSPAAWPPENVVTQIDRTVNGVPEMIGDSYFPGGRVLAGNNAGATIGSFEFTSRRVNIAENNSPFLQERVFVVYRRFDEAVEGHATNLLGAVANSRESVQQVTAGFEWMPFQHPWSIQAQFTYTTNLDFNSPNVSLDGTGVGSSTVIWKRLLHFTPTSALSAGFGVHWLMDNETLGTIAGTPVRLNEEGLYVQPFAGYVNYGSPCWFHQYFLQFSVPVHDNRLEILNPGRSTGIDDPVLFHADASVGYWLYQDSYARHLTGVAVIGELHYTNNLEDTDQFTLVDAGGNNFVLSNNESDMDYLNATLGVQIDLYDQTSIRVAAVIPLASKTFDVAAQIGINRRF